VVGSDIPAADAGPPAGGLLPLSGLDAAFLAAETPTMPMHVAAVAFLRPEDGGGLDAGRLGALLQGREGEAPLLGRRLEEGPCGLARPLWLAGAGFDPDGHCHAVTVSAPGDRDALLRAAAEIVARPLARDRPLWEVWVLDSPTSGARALVAKVHHAAVDGVLGMEMLAAVFDVTPEPRPAGGRPATGPARPRETDRAWWVAAETLSVPRRTLVALREGLEAAAELRRRNRRATAVPPGLFDAPPTGFNRPISKRRTLATSAVGLARVREVARRHDVTVNDVVLAVVAGALRRQLLAVGDLPPEPLVAMVPVSLRRRDRTPAERGGGPEPEGRSEGRGTNGLPGPRPPSANRVAAMLVRLPTQLPDPMDRLAALSAETGRAKEQLEAVGGDLLADVFEAVPPLVVREAARCLRDWVSRPDARPPVNLVVSNVIGPSFPLWVAGARVEEVFPFGPIGEGVPLNVTVVSYDGTLEFGLTGCPDVVPWVPELAGLLLESLEEIAVGGRRSSGRREGATATGW